MSKSLSIENEYGNVDVRYSIPGRYKHINGKRLQPLCRKLGIKYAPAFVGFGGSKRYPKPLFSGVVVSCRSAAKLQDEIAAREKRNSPEKKAQAAAYRERKKNKEYERLRAMGIDPDSRTAQWLRRGHIDDYEAQLIAFKAYYRHECTDYDQLLNATQSREESRYEATESEIPTEWDTYLRRYDFPYPDVAQALAKILKSPESAHPIWFAEAVLAVKRSDIDVESLTYRDIRDTITNWRYIRDLDD